MEGRSGTMTQAGKQAKAQACIHALDDATATDPIQPVGVRVGS